MTGSIGGVTLVTLFAALLTNKIRLSREEIVFILCYLIHRFHFYLFIYNFSGPVCVRVFADLHGTHIFCGGQTENGTGSCSFDQVFLVIEKEETTDG